MDKDGIYLSPSSILAIRCKETEESYGERRKFYYITLVTKENAYANSNKTYKISFNLTEKGFTDKKEIDELVEKLLNIMKYPMTCGSIIKLTQSIDNYNIEII